MGEYEEMTEEDRKTVEGIVAELTQVAKERGCSCDPPRILVYLYEDNVGVRFVHQPLCIGLMKQRGVEGQN